MADKSVDLILTDIPYCCKKETNFKSIKEYTSVNHRTEYSCMNFGEWDESFDIDKYFKQIFRIIKEHRSIVVWCNWMQLKEIYDCYLKYIPKQLQREPRIGVWQKTNPSVFNMQRMAIQPYEFFIWLGVGNNVIFNNQNIPKAERHYFESAIVRGEHPTMKNVEHFEKLIKTYTNENDLVLDCFMGSGTTGVACINTNRNFIGIELDDNYFKIAEDRINKVKESIFDM